MTEAEKKAREAANKTAESIYSKIEPGVVGRFLVAVASIEIERAILAARRDAIEECAKVAQRFGYSVPQHSYEKGFTAAVGLISSAIRALAEPPHGG